MMQLQTYKDLAIHLNWQAGQEEHWDQETHGSIWDQ